jgi:acetamidase/formamidase
MSQSFLLRSSPQTCHWGFFDAALPPVMTVHSGDTVTIEAVSGDAQILPQGGGFHILPEHQAILEAMQPKLGPHILTGPIEVEGALPGDVLQIDIQAVELRQNWGWNIIRPFRGTLPEDFPKTKIWHTAIDLERRVGTLPWGSEIALRPFFGIMGVAPRPAYGALGSIEPREYGGNMDLKELVAGTTLYLPIWTRGALFSVGDGHAVQGDGEVCLTGLETALRGTFKLSLRKDMSLSLPIAETATHAITLAFDPDLDDAAKQALRAMIALLVSRSGLAPDDAYMLCSLAADVRVTQLVDGNKGVHVMIDKRWLQPAPNRGSNSARSTSTIAATTR